MADSWSTLGVVLIVSDTEATESTGLIYKFPTESLLWSSFGVEICRKTSRSLTAPMTVVSKIKFNILFQVESLTGQIPRGLEFKYRSSLRWSHIKDSQSNHRENDGLGPRHVVVSKYSWFENSDFQSNHQEVELYSFFSIHRNTLIEIHPRDFRMWMKFPSHEYTELD